MRGGFFGFGGIVTFSIDGRDFAAHGAQIGGELSAVVDGVLDAEIEIGDGGKLEHAAEVHDAGGLLGGKRVRLSKFLAKESAYHLRMFSLVMPPSGRGMLLKSKAPVRTPL